jgi:hypothetical protein
LFTCFWYQAGTWPCARYVFAKAEANDRGTNRRFVVTNRPGAVLLPEETYDEYAARGESENRNREFKCDLAMDLQSDHRGTPELVRAEQEAILRRLADNPFRRTCFVLDFETGKESVHAPVLYIAGNQGCGIPPVRTANGQAVIFYRTVYLNWNLGVKPAVGLGYLDPKEGWITPLRHRQGNTPSWNTHQR